MSEHKTEIFKPQAKTIEGIFGDADSYYQIPDYQRPYNWEDEQIDELWDDLYSAMESKDEGYFLGPIILIKKTEDGYLEVIDGQQRLTTLTILFCVIRDLYGKDLEGSGNKLLINIIRDSVKSMREERPRLKLITQSNHQIKFEQEILNGVNFPDEEPTNRPREDGKFINAALKFKEKLDELKNNGGIDAIKNFAEYILNKTEMITITCAKQSDAIKLFQVLNTRGLDLSPSDLIKSHLYSKLRTAQEKEQFISNWREVERRSEDVDETITDLLTYYAYYLLAQKPGESLYKELTDKFKNKDSKTVIFDFDDFVESFNEIYQMESKIIFSLWYLPNKVFWKAILTTAKKEKFNDFEGLCKELRKVYYSYWIADYTTSKIKQLSFNIIDLIKSKKSMAEIRKAVEDKMKKDNVIKRVEENLKNDAYGKSWLKPLLALIEYEQTDNSRVFFVEMDKKIHADHILPEKWHNKEEWKKMWTEEQANNHLNKIGNLTLLSGKKNIAQQNDPPCEKAEIYNEKHGGTTSFEISRMLINKLEKGSWNKDDVEKRQKWVIEQIMDILGIKFN